MNTSDVLVVGGGINGLVAAAYLARAGVKPLVLERMDRVGGAATTFEVAPGFRCPTLAHAVSLDPVIVRSLALERHGLDMIAPAASACAPTRDGRALTIWADHARTAHDLAAFSAHDAAQYPRFIESFANVSAVIRAINAAPPPSIDAPGAGDLIELLKTGRRFRALGRSDAYRLLRWMPMAAADLASEWFDSEPLRALVAAGGTLGSFLGPWSAGSGALLLMLGALQGEPMATGPVARGGPGAIAEALAGAARQAGATIRTSAEVGAIAVDDRGANGVVLASGEELKARAVVSALDPVRTLLRLVDASQLEPGFVQRVRNIRMQGTLAKVNYAVSTLPAFSCLASRASEAASVLSGRIRLAADIDSIERAFDAAKYGRYADEPWIELTIPSIVDPALAPAGQHVVSAYAQFAPYRLRGTTWDAERDRFGDLVTRTISQYVPRFESTVVARQVITPLDLERTYGLTGGHIFHGELALDQFFVTRPLLGWARYRTPIPGLYLCGSGTHPGAAAVGRSGALAAREITRDLKK